MISQFFVAVISLIVFLSFNEKVAVESASIGAIAQNIHSDLLLLNANLASTIEPNLSRDGRRINLNKFAVPSGNAANYYKVDASWPNMYIMFLTSINVLRYAIELIIFWSITSFSLAQYNLHIPENDYHSHIHTCCINYCFGNITQHDTSSVSFHSLQAVRSICFIGMASFP